MARPRSANPSLQTLAQREYRRRKALAARLLKVVAPSDVIDAIADRGVDPDDPVALGELLDDLLFG